jgi:glycine C-acetyltransferase
MMQRDATGFLKAEVDSLKASGLYWDKRVLSTASQPHAVVNGRKTLLMCSNNYLGLATHPKLTAAAVKAVQEYGAGSGSVPVIAGTMELHREFEERLARFKGVEAALCFQTGFAVNAGLIPQLAGEGDVIISDELNHGSIIDGTRSSKAEKAIYKHADVADLQRVLGESEKKNPRRILVITDGVFSMDGDIAPLPQIAKLCHEHGAMLYVDDCHGEGVLGEGRGIVHHFHLQGKVHVEGGCMSKGFGSFGGSVSGTADLIDYARNKTRSYLLSSSLSPAVVAACTAAIEVLETEPQHVKTLWENTNYFRKGLTQLGFDTGKSETPIIPVIIGESTKAQAFSRELFENGVFALPIVFPMVAKDKARIRCMLNSLLSRGDLDFAIAAFEKVGKKLAVI